MTVDIEKQGLSLGEELFAKARRCEILNNIFSERGVDIFADDAIEQILGEKPGTLSERNKDSEDKPETYGVVTMSNRYDDLVRKLSDRGVDLNDPSNVVRLVKRIDDKEKKDEG